MLRHILALTVGNIKFEKYELCLPAQRPIKKYKELWFKFQAFIRSKPHKVNNQLHASTVLLTASPSTEAWTSCRTSMKMVTERRSNFVSNTDRPVDPMAGHYVG